MIDLRVSASGSCDRAAARLGSAASVRVLSDDAGPDSVCLETTLLVASERPSKGARPDALLTRHLLTPAQARTLGRALLEAARETSARSLKA